MSESANESPSVDMTEEQIENVASGNADAATEDGPDVESEGARESVAATETETRAEPETASESEIEGEARAADDATEIATDETADPSAEQSSPAPSAEPAAGAPDEAMAPAVLALQEKLQADEIVKGKIIGWNKGGFHVVCEAVTAFCPNSEMELGKVRAPKEYLDQSYDFAVLRIEDSGRRVVLSRTKVLKGKRAAKRAQLRQKVQAGAEMEGRVASLTNFGAFVDLGGVQGLVHVSEISRSRVEDPASVLSVGQKVKVKVLKVEQGGKRISLSMKALEPDPWKGVAERFPEGSVVQGTVERTASFGAFIRLAPGLTGLLPASVMNLPRDASINRMYSPGKELSVMVMSVDPRRRRISLALEGSQTEGSRSDFEKFKKAQADEASGRGFNALAAAFQKIQKQG